MGAGVVLAVLGGGYAAAYAYYGDRVVDGTTVLGVDIGGQTRPGAEQTLTDELPPIADQPLTLLVEDAAYRITPSRSGLDVDVTETVRRAPGGGANPVSLAKAVFAGGGPVDPVVVVDAEALAASVAGVAEETDRAPVEGNVRFVDGEVRTRDAVVGLTVEQEGSAEVIAAAYLVEAAPIALPTEVVEPAVGQEDVDTAVKDFADPAMAAPVQLRSDQGTSLVTPEQLSPSLAMRPDPDGALKPVMDESRLLKDIRGPLLQLGRPPVDAKVQIRGNQPVVVPSSTGVRADTSDVAEDVFDVLPLARAERTVTVPTRPAKPAFSTADAEASGVKRVVAEFTTAYPHADYRNTNIGRAAELVNNTFLQPGEEFSLNAATGPRTVEKGFVSGTVIENGIYKEGLAGGVSQLATTVFNAGYFAGYEDLEHHPHSFYIDRYPMGRESTTVFGALDVRFKNDTPYGSVITAFIRPSSPGGQGSVTVQVWSSKYWRVGSSTGSPFNYSQPETKTVSDSGCQPSTGSQGFDVVVNRTVLGPNGQRSADELFTRYQPVPTVICQ